MVGQCCQYPSLDIVYSMFAETAAWYIHHQPATLVALAVQTFLHTFAQGQVLFTYHRDEVDDCLLFGIGARTLGEPLYTLLATLRAQGYVV